MGKSHTKMGLRSPKWFPLWLGQVHLQSFPLLQTCTGLSTPSMPFQKPNSLSDDDYYKITAFLLRQNGLIDTQTDVNELNVAQIVVSRATPVPTPQPSNNVQGGGGALGWIILVGSLVALFILLFALKKSRNTTTI